jgi:uncharacterized repeat protein (TIGR03803 family)
MTNTQGHKISACRKILRLGTASLVVTVIVSWVISAPRSAAAQTFTVIHNFSGGSDGSLPSAGLAIDGAGRLYGTTFSGGSGACFNEYGSEGCGTVFGLVRKPSSWVFYPLYNFKGGNDGAAPQLGSLTIAPDGSLYGATVSGGGGPCAIYGYNGCGTVFHLRPQPSVCEAALCPWDETVLYRFPSGSDGSFPDGSPIFGSGGNLYGVADGYPVTGNIFELSPSGSSWIYTVAYAFSGPDGQIPVGELIFDASGNLYGTTWIGGLYGNGTAWRLTPSTHGWTNILLHSFQGAPDGSLLYAGLVFDNLGDLFGVTTNGGANGAGTIFELTTSGDNWTFNVLYNFVGNSNCGSYGNLLMDTSGNLYGTTLCTGAWGKGSVFELAYSGREWTYTSLHDFSGGSDGANPYCSLVFDANGNLYGTTFYGGANNKGVVFEITTGSL